MRIESKRRVCCRSVSERETGWIDFDDPTLYIDEGPVSGLYTSVHFRLVGLLITTIFNFYFIFLG